MEGKRKKKKAEKEVTFLSKGVPYLSYMCVTIEAYLSLSISPLSLVSHSFFVAA